MGGSQIPGTGVIGPREGFFHFGPFRFDRENCLLYRDAQELAVPPKALFIIEHLLGEAGNVVSKEELIEAVWGDVYVSEASLTQAVSVARKALGDDSHDPQYIQTIHGRGYRFVAPVETTAAKDDSPSGPLGRLLTSDPGSADGWHGRREKFTLVTLGGLVLVLIIGALLMAKLVMTESDEPGSVQRFPVALHKAIVPARLPSVAISPDGGRIVYASGSGPSDTLYLRTADRLDATPISGTEGASGPFFSPDGEWLGFFAGGALMKMSMGAGTRPTIVATAPDPRGGTWLADDTIVFAPYLDGGLWRVSATGGNAEPLTIPEIDDSIVSHRWPDALAASSAVVFTKWSGAGYDSANIALLNLETGEKRDLIPGGTNARYTPTGHLLYTRGSSLMAAPFDLQRLAPRGEAFEVLRGVLTISETGASHFAVSPQGRLAYLSIGDDAFHRALTLVDLDGTESLLTHIRRPFQWARFSPDGEKVAVTIEDDYWNVWVYERDRDTLTRLTFEGNNLGAVWAPDGESVIFSSKRSGQWNLYLRKANGSGEAKRLTTSRYRQSPSAWSPDGRLVAFVEVHPESRSDIWVLPMEDGSESGEPVAFLRTSYDEHSPAFSPDGRWLAYASNESGRSEVYLRRFPSRDEKRQVSTDGGSEPLWAPDGGCIYFWKDDQLLATDFDMRQLIVGSPRLLFEGEYESVPAFASYDVNPDGDYFLMIRKDTREASANRLNVVLDWFAELRQIAQEPVTGTAPY